MNPKPNNFDPSWSQLLMNACICAFPFISHLVYQPQQLDIQILYFLLR
jgi:hypothetical protein